MSNNLRKFPSIDQYKNVITNIRQYCKKHEQPLPTLTFEGTIKLHGTNGGIGLNLATGELWAQSRERIITPYDDNAAFAKFVEANKDQWRTFLASVIESDVVKLEGAQFAVESFQKARVVIFGEWAGPNIQKGVAISQIESKSFFPFDIKVYIPGADDEDVLVLTYDPMDFPMLTLIPDTYRIGSFQTHTLDIDFARPQDFQNELVDLTLKVEENCPVAAEFGQSGVGEGIVWYNRETGLRFKVKGEKHSMSKVSTVKPISEEELARISTIKNFVDTVVTDNRLNQGLDKLREMGKPLTVQSTGEYIKWVVGDVLKEEMDLIVASMLDKKELNPAMSNKAKDFYFAFLNSQDSLAA
jgi:hypothetical protein